MEQIKVIGSEIGLVVRYYHLGRYQEGFRLYASGLIGTLLVWLMPFLDWVEAKLSYYYYYFLGRPLMPFSAAIDPMNQCNLACPLCPTGAGKLVGNIAKMPLSLFKSAVLSLGNNVRRIALFNWGEPFLSPEIFPMIKVLKGHAKYVEIHSNFSFVKQDKFFEDLARSGLDRLILSIDGASQESFEKYRVGGNFELVIDNIKRLKAVQTKLNLKTTKIFWKMVVSRHNEHEVLKAKSMARDLGVLFALSSIILGDMDVDTEFDSNFADRKKTWLSTNPFFVKRHYRSSRMSQRRGVCKHLFADPTIDPSGDVFPCGNLIRKENAFGNIRDQKFKDIWMNEKFTFSRNLFIKNAPLDFKHETVCSRCNIYEHRNRESPILQGKKSEGVLGNRLCDT